METDSELNDLLESIVDLKTIIGTAQMSNGTITTTGGTSTVSYQLSGLSGTSGSIGPMGILNYNGYSFVTPNTYSDESLRDTELKAQPETIIDNIQELISRMESTEDEEMQKACKHLTFAKAYLEKMVLDKLNQKL